MLTAIQQEPLSAHPTTNSMLREVQAVHEAVKGLTMPPASPPSPPSPTLAQILTALAPTPPKSRNPQPQGPELTIRISDPEERKNAQSLPNEELIQRIQQERPDGKEVLEVIWACPRPARGLKVRKMSRQAYVSRKCLEATDSYPQCSNL